MPSAALAERSSLRAIHPSFIEEEKKQRAERSLGSFIRQAWKVVEPGTPYVAGWHIDAICDHLEAVSRGEIRNLLINMPPRHMKSLTVSVFWPCWEWLRWPERRWLFSSYAASLSIRDSIKCRRILDSPWYRGHWGDRFRLTTDQNTKLRFDNDKTGYRIASSVDGANTGEGGDRLVVDDPHNVMEAESALIRASTLAWWDEVMSSRLNNPSTGAKVIVMQRTHEADLSGHVLERGGYEHLCLPAEYEGDKKVTGIGWSDPRVEAGELLWPERFTPEALAELKLSLGLYAAAGQLQQRPAPRSGGMFQRHWFQSVDAVPIAGMRVRWWDKAASDGKGDWTVGVLMVRSDDGLFFIEDVVRGQWSSGERNTVMLQVTQDDAAKYGNRVMTWVEQEPGSGGKESAESSVKLLAGHSVRYERSTGDKTTRADPFAAQCEAGNVRVLKADWNAAYLDELCGFPMGKHDDQVDASSGAFNKLATEKKLQTNASFHAKYWGLDELERDDDA